VSFIRDHRIEFAVVPSRLPHLTAGFDHHVVISPTWSAAYVLSDLAAVLASLPFADAQAQVTSRLMSQVVVLEAAGRLGDVVKDLDRAIQLALADGPPGVVCDLSAVLACAEPVAVEVLATAGRHVRDWPGIPVVVACPNPRVREVLAAHPIGGHLIVTASLLSALSAVPATATPAVQWLRLAPHPTAPRASRNFVARTLLGWGLGSLIPCASLVVSELVTNSTIHAGSDIVVSLAWIPGALRLTVRDGSPDLPRQPYSKLDEHGRGLRVVAGLSRAFGVLPTGEGGKVVWAVVNAARAGGGTVNV
jgi:hypothetical protein